MLPLHLITWHAYGTWLPGDDRGWTAHRQRRPMPPSRALWRHCAAQLRWVQILPRHA
jgi:hypothetical protein